ncbi:putative MFS alpha-glucoside transporter [Xylariales sp. PMI_506]|nr:putative MFS alpha-glucoside transporter [Xylariales sp. PMI_506]
MAEHQENVADPRSVTVLQEKDEEHFVDSSDVLKGAVNATEDQHKMGLAEGLRKYPKACFWSLLFSMALIMEGFDHAFVTGFFAFPAFQQRYGVKESTGDYQVPAYLQSGVSNGVSAGQIIGLLMNGMFADWFGYRWVMIGCLIMMTGFIFLQFFATSIYMYLGAEILLGIPWGAFQTLTTTYAAEVCPNVLRPYLTSLVSLCWSVGYLLGTGALRGFDEMTGQWAYRIPFALQWIWPIPLIIGIFLAPESPWWLVRKGRIEDATTSLRNLQSKGVTEEELADTISMMIYTIKLEDERKTASTYLDLFKGVDFRRTEVAVGAYLIQNLLAPLMSYIVYFLEQAGLPSTTSFDFAMGEYSLAIMGVFVEWYITPMVGRRTLMLWGTTFLVVTTFVIAFLGIPPIAAHPNIAYGIGSILLIEYFVFFITVGPVVYTIVTEIPSDYLRIKTVVFARTIYNVVGLINGQLVPRMIQNATWGWGAKSAFYFGFWMLVCLIWAFFRLPESKNRTFAEMDILFKQKVPARKFVNTKVDLANQTVSEE